MILTHSMVTNNHIGEEPRITALERLVQTLAVAMERLSKTTTWRNSYAKGMLGPTVMERRKKASVLK